MNKFVRNDKTNNIVRSINLEDGYVESQYRESRDENGNLTLLNKTEARSLLKGVEIYNTELNNIESF
jgi:HEPN domain-containing protein